MSQEIREQTHDRKPNLPSLELSPVKIGSLAIKPFVGGYNLSKSAINAIVPGQLLRNLGEMAEAAVGLRDGVRPVKIEKKPAKIDTFDQGDPWA